MATTAFHVCKALNKVHSAPPVFLLAFRGLRTTWVSLKNIRAGVPKATINRNKPLTYEQAQAPYKIGVTKGWNSWHTADSPPASQAYDITSPPLAENKVKVTLNITGSSSLEVVIVQFDSVSRVYQLYTGIDKAHLDQERFDARPALMTFDDLLIRKFMMGTWPGLLASEVIIKRRQNMIVVACLVVQQLTPRKVYFLLGYSEEMLSFLLKCPVKLEIQTVQDKKDVIFKKI